MNLADVYHKQYARRSWSHIYEMLPPMSRTTILDLGCGPGDQAAECVARGVSTVIGVDLIEELLEAARARGLANCTFLKADLRQSLDIPVMVDGIWVGFSAAYFTDLPVALVRWKQHLKPGGWIVLIEIDDFFGHEPLRLQTVSLLEGYSREAAAAGRYDFQMGRKLGRYLEDAGFHLQQSFALPDPEFSFDGPASDEVIEAWQLRFGYMKLLRDYCRDKFDDVRRDFLDCLKSPCHRCNATVQCRIATLAKTRS